MIKSHYYGGVLSGMGIDRIRNEAIVEFKNLLKRVCDNERISCVHLLIEFYYQRIARYNNWKLNQTKLSYELEFQMKLDIMKLSNMTQQELEEYANFWLEKLSAVDEFYDC